MSLKFFLLTLFSIEVSYTAWKVSKYGVFSGPYFPVFGLNTGRYLSLRIQSECGKVRTRKNSVFGHFSRSVSNGSKLLALKVYGHDCFENHFKASISFRTEIPFQSNIVENWPRFTLRASSFEVGLITYQQLHWSTHHNYFDYKWTFDGFLDYNVSLMEAASNSMNEFVARSFFLIDGNMAELQLQSILII